MQPPHPTPTHITPCTATAPWCIRTSGCWNGPSGPKAQAHLHLPVPQHLPLLRKLLQHVPLPDVLPPAHLHAVHDLQLDHRLPLQRVQQHGVVAPQPLTLLGLCLHNGCARLQLLGLHQRVPEQRMLRGLGLTQRLAALLLLPLEPHTVPPRAELAKGLGLVVRDEVPEAPLAEKQLVLVPRLKYDAALAGLTDCQEGVESQPVKSERGTIVGPGIVLDRGGRGAGVGGVPQKAGKYHAV